MARQSPGQLHLFDERRGVRGSKQGHGSRACYIAGCREPQCKAANASYQRDYRNGTRGTHAHRLGPYRLEAS